MKYFKLTLIFLIPILIASYAFLNQHTHSKFIQKKSKIYWFIPDGLRAEEDVFKIFEWAKNGELPNLRRLMLMGAYGYSRPVFPSHTPTNFATLLTGTLPNIHGIADGAMRTIGYPLSMVSRGGFSSTSKNVPSIWTLFEDHNEFVSLLSIPGSTPPEIKNGVTIKGRWGGWGIDFPSIIFHSAKDKNLSSNIGINKRVFTFGSDLTKFLETQSGNADPISKKITSYSPLRMVDVSNWGMPLFAYLADSINDEKEYYDVVYLSKDRNTIFSTVRESAWSDWLPVDLFWQVKNDYNINSPKKFEFERKLSNIKIPTGMKIKVIKLGKKDFFRIRVIYDNLNNYITEPYWVAEEMQSKFGPMVDFVDNYPPQLIYYPEDKITFLQEAELSWNWHKNAVSYLVKDLNSDLVIHSIYSPNQMLTSRWWLPYIDPLSPLYKSINEHERSILWSEVKSMYKKVDDVLGEIMKNMDSDSYIIFSSDHGALPLFKEVLLNNLFIKNGWLKYKYNPSLDQYDIDWHNSKVVFLQMNNVYINPKGLGGLYTRSKTPEYFKLRQEVINVISSLVDNDTGISPLKAIWTWENADQISLPKDRVGDLIISNSPTMLWAEDITPDKEIFRVSLKGGYKQGVSGDVPGLLTPFLISGPGIKENYKLPSIINHADQFSTIMKLKGFDNPNNVSGRIIEEVFVDKILINKNPATH